MGEWSDEYGSKATLKKIYIGKGVKYFSKLQVGEFILESDQLSVGTSIMITGPTTGIINTVIEELRVGDQRVETVRKGESFSMPLGETIRPSDKLYKILPVNDPNPSTSK